MRLRYRYTAAVIKSIAIAIVTLFTLGCGDSNAPPPAAPADPTPAGKAPADPVPAAAPVDQGSKLQPAEDVFQWSFAESIARDDLQMWRGLLSTRMAARLDGDKVQAHFDAWKTPLKPVVEEIRNATAKIIKSGDRTRIQFVGVTIPGDPDTADVVITVTLEKGVFKIDEN